MKPFDDTIPEENTPPYQDLVSLLRQATPASSVTPEEYSQMLARVRARLHQTDTILSEDASTVAENPGSIFQPSLLRRKAPQHFSGVWHTWNMIAAILVVGVIAGASLFLFTSRQSSLGGSIPIGAPIGSIKPPMAVQSQASGLEASLQVTSGPYFLSELLTTTFTLTNHSKNRLSLLGAIDDSNPCGGAGLFHLTLTGGSEPYYSFPISKTIISCPPDMAITTVDVGKTLTTHGYILLTKSGQVTLTSEAIFLIPTNDSHTVNKTQNHFSINGMTQSSSPLDGQWPAIHMAVATKIPVDRTLSLRQQGSQITINAPVAARSHLVYNNVAICTEKDNTNGSVNISWNPMPTTTLQMPKCSGTAHWIYAVSAPGYAIVSGEMSS